jgi:hypothetical protein
MKLTFFDPRTVFSLKTVALLLELFTFSPSILRMIKKYLILLALNLTVCSAVRAQNFRQIGSRQAGMAYASVALNDIWAFHNNPGMLGFLNETGAGVYYENRFFLKEFQYQGLVYAQPLKRGTLSVGGQYSGFNLYSTSRAGVGYALALSERLSMGVQINYMNVRQPSYYGTKHGISGEFGLGVKVTSKWTFAMAINNLTRSNLADFQNERFETIFRAGTLYELSKRVIISTELEKDITFPLRVKVGMEYHPAEPFYIRAGAAVNATSLALGFGYVVKNIRIDLGSNYVQPLGFHTAASINFMFPKRATE